MPACTIRAKIMFIDDQDNTSSNPVIGAPETNLYPVSSSKFACSAVASDAYAVDEFLPNEKTTNGACVVSAAVPEHAGVEGGQMVRNVGGELPPK